MLGRYSRHYVVPTWRLFDATGQSVGKLASNLARYVQGKHKPNFDPSQMNGDYCVVINSRYIQFRGENAWRDKKYIYHTRYPGGLRARHAWWVMRKDPTDILRKAIRKMLPKNKQRYWMMRYLKIYPGPYHPHQAQFMPINLEHIYNTQVKQHTNYILHGNIDGPPRTTTTDGTDDTTTATSIKNSNVRNQNNDLNKDYKQYIPIKDGASPYGFETYQRQQKIKHQRTPIDRKWQFKNKKIQKLLIQQAKMEYLNNQDINNDDSSKKSFNQVIKDIKQRERNESENVIGIETNQSIKFDDNGNQIIVSSTNEYLPKNENVASKIKSKKGILKNKRYRYSGKKYQQNEAIELHGFPRLSLTDRRSIPNYIKRDRRFVRQRYLPKLVIKQGSKEEKLYLNYMEKQDATIPQQRKKAGRIGSS